MLEVEYINTDELIPYAGNAKLHPSEQIEQIKRSIEEFGFNDPIAVWHDNVIIEGHGRLIAAVELGLEEVPIIRLDELTDEQRRAYTLVHNKLTMNSGFDMGTLELELDDIEMDMSEFGFDMKEEPVEEPEPKEEREKPDEIKVIVRAYQNQLEILEEILKDMGFMYEVKGV